jgi:predicted methyltransferase
MMINLNYHDVYWESAKYGIPRMDPEAFLKTVYASMKPGGIVGVIDHVANPGDTRENVEKFHRIDPATVKADFEKAGFKLAGTSDILRNPADDHSLLVFNPQIRGKTDRFIYKFVKPK